MSDIISEQTFEDKIKDRLRQDIGSLMPDEILTKLIAKAIKYIFFEPRISKDKQGNVLNYKRSWFQETVESYLRKRIKELLDDYIKEHEVELKAKFTEILATKGPKLVADWFIGFLIGQQSNIIMKIQNELQDILRNRDC